MMDAPGSADHRRKFRESGRAYRQTWTDEDMSASFTRDGSPLLPPSPARDRHERAARRGAARRIQLWYRRQVLKYATFGPMIFTRRDGKIADFGSLSFLGGTRTAHFVRVSDTTSSATLSHFLEKYWRLPRPDVLISVTGSAASLHLTAQLQRVFDRGLAAAAAMTNAWIFTGGTDSGVMKLVGEAMHKYGLIDVPVVGVAPWGAISARKSLERCKGEEVEVRCRSTGADADGRLNPYHTHQILIDGHRQYGEGTIAWGHETRMRAELEKTYASSKGESIADWSLRAYQPRMMQPAC